MSAPSKMANNSFLGIDHISVCRGTTLFLASMNDIQFSFTKYATSLYACAEASQETCNATSEAVDRLVHHLGIFSLLRPAIDLRKISTFP